MRLIAIALTLLLSGIAHAQTQVVGHGSAYWSGQTTTSGGTNCIRTSTATDARCALFPTGTEPSSKFHIFTVTSSGAWGACCLSQSSTVTISGMAISEPGESGPGACMPFNGTGAVWTGRGQHVDLQPLGGGRFGICRGSVWNSGDLIHPPCNSSGACQSAGLSGSAATCDSRSSWTTRQTGLAGAYLLCGSTYTTTFSVVKEAVQR